MCRRLHSAAGRWLFALFVVSIAAVVPATAQQGRDSVFARANTAFQQGEYAEAERLYRSLAESGSASAQLFFNLGNALYRQDCAGEAALWFRRALVLDPRMIEARQNLRVIKHRTGYLEFKPEGINEFLVRVAEGEIMAIFVAGLWIALLIAAALIVFKRLRSWRPLLSALVTIALGVAAVSGWCLQRQRAELSLDGLAIVVSPDTRAVTGPVPDAEKVVELPEGSQVRVVLDRGAWSYVDVPGDLRGWVRTESIGPVVNPADGPAVQG